MKTFKICLLVALIFVAGFAGGVVATRVAVRHFVREAMIHPEVIRLRVERDLANTLRLTPPQRMRTRQILQRTNERVRQLRQEFQPRFEEIMQQTRVEISATLTPEQRQRFEDFQLRNQMFLPRPPMRRPQPD